MGRDDIVVEMFHELRGMVFNFARAYQLDFDDCLQDAAEIMLRVYPRIPEECTNEKAYLCGAVKRELYQRLRGREESAASLDAPLAEDSEVTFADMLADFVEQEDKRAEHVAKTVHTALRKLSLEVQFHVRDFYGLGSFNPRLTRKVVYGRKKEYMRESLRRSFRKDSQILALMR